MKKTMAVLAAGLILTMAPAAAEPVNISGDVAAKYQRDTGEGEPAVTGSVYTVRIKGEAELSPGWSLYARIGAQSVTAPAQADFNPAAYGGNKKTVAAVDQFGLNYQTEKWRYKLGRQDASVGTTALLYSVPDSNIGRQAFVDGLSFSGTAGAVEVSALAAREDNPASELKNKVYAIRAGYSPSDNVNYGLTVGRYVSGESTNHWAVDGTYKYGKSSITAEYTKSSSNANNDAYAIVWNYEFDDKLSASITGFRVEESGSMGQKSDFDFGNRGMHYDVNYKLSDNTGLALIYKDQKSISEGKKNTSFEATLNFAF